MATAANRLDGDDQRRIEALIIDVVRELARELGGDRAASAATATASLEREVGLGSIERVELLMRLEVALGRELDDRFLLLDTPREIARAVATAPILREVRLMTHERPPPAVSIRLDDVTTLVDALHRRAVSEPNRLHVL